MITPERAEETPSSWEGKLHYMKVFIEESQRENLSQMKKMERNLERQISVRLEEKLRGNEERMTLKLTNMDAKIEKLLTHFHVGKEAEKKEEQKKP